MSELRTIIAIVQQTIISTVTLFDEIGTGLAQQTTELSKHLPIEGCVEHAPRDVLRINTETS